MSKLYFVLTLIVLIGFVGYMIFFMHLKTSGGLGSRLNKINNQFDYEVKNLKDLPLIENIEQLNNMKIVPTIQYSDPIGPKER